MGKEIKLALVLATMRPTAALADTCVVLSTTFATKGVEQLAFATSFGANLFDTAVERNAAYVQDWSQSVDTA